MVKDGDGKTWIIVECRSCGLIAAGPRDGVGLGISLHFEEFHDSKIAIEHRDFTTRVAPLRCDTCSSPVELPYWSHISDPPTHQRSMKDVDGIWLLCDTCHTLATTGQSNAWLRHCWARAVAGSPWLETGPGRDETRVALGQHLRLLMTRLDAGDRNTIHNPGPLRG